MSSEPNKDTPQNAERAAREATFSRRGLLQWSVPVIMAVSLPAQVSAGSNHGDSHNDTHGDGHDDTHGDSHVDFAPKGRTPHGDSHADHHGDSRHGGSGAGRRSRSGR
jgi:hypothetical protein